MRRIVVVRRIVVGICLLAGIVAAVALTAVPGSAQQPAARELTLVERGFRFGTVDNPPRGARRGATSPGDVVTQSWTVHDDGGTRLGTAHQVCTATTPGRRPPRRGAYFHCTGSHLLRDGSLQFAFAFREGEANGDAATAVVGGTGAYEGARGTLSSTGQLPGPLRTTVRLLP